MERKKLHTRTIVYEGYFREDGLWDIEGSIIDTKSYPHPSIGRGLMEPGTPIHRMSVKLTLDDKYLISEATCDMGDFPFDYCAGAAPPVSNLAGKTLGRGWRKSVDEVLAGTKSCTHVRELLYAIATPAFQTIPTYRQVLESGSDMSARYKSEDRPYFLNQCYSWSVESPVVKDKFPDFYEGK